jgi:hypothetical protein
MAGEAAAERRSLERERVCVCVRGRKKERGEREVGRGWVEPNLGQADPVGLGLMGQFGLAQLDQSTLLF